LLGLGLRNLSMHPAQLLTIKQRVLATDVAALSPFIARMRRSDDPAKLSAQLDKLNE
jgi:phosphotransferase system enzyme I (PtsI)